MRIAPLLVISASLLACKKKSPEESQTASPTVESTTDVSVAEADESGSSTDAMGDSSAGVASPTAAADAAGPERAPARGLQAQLDEATAQLTRHDAIGAQRALEILEPLSNQHPEIAGIEYNMGVAYLILDDSLNARKRFLRATEVDPAFSEAWLNMAIMSDEGGDLPRRGPLQGYPCMGISMGIPYPCLTPKSTTLT